MERKMQLQEFFWTKDFGWMMPLRTLTCIICILFIQVLLHLADKLEKSTSSTDTSSDTKLVRGTRSWKHLRNFYDGEKQCQRGNVVAEEKLISATSRHKGFGPCYYLPCSVASKEQYVLFQVDTGCTTTSISLNTVKTLGLQHKLNTNERVHFEAMGSVIHRTVGTLKVLLKTASGLPILKKMNVIDLASKNLLGMDVLEVLNCSIITDTSNPKLLIRKKSACCPTRTYGDASIVPATLNGWKTPVLLDTGSSKTFLPPDLDFTLVSLSDTVEMVGAAPGTLRLKHKIDLLIDVNGCAGSVSALVISEDIPVIGTDFLKNKKIDIICGRAYVTEL